METHEKTRKLWKSIKKKTKKTLDFSIQKTAKSPKSLLKFHRKSNENPIRAHQNRKCNILEDCASDAFESQYFSVAVNQAKECFVLFISTSWVIGIKCGWFCLTYLWLEWKRENNLVAHNDTMSGGRINWISMYFASFTIDFAVLSPWSRLKSSLHTLIRIKWLNW